MGDRAGRVVRVRGRLDRNRAAAVNDRRDAIVGLWLVCERVEKDVE